MTVSTDVFLMNHFCNKYKAITTLNSINHTRVCHLSILCPRSTDNIQPEVRAFTPDKMLTIDTATQWTAILLRLSYLLASLLVVMIIPILLVYSKDFKKDFSVICMLKMTALRIKRPIVLDMPIFSRQDHPCDLYYYN